MNFDTPAAKHVAMQLCEQFKEVFTGGPRAAVYPIVIGIETDREGLHVHGTADPSKELRLWDNLDSNEAMLRVQVNSLLPGLDSQMVDDIVPLLRGNIEHIKYVLTLQRPIVELDHRENVIAVGVGFDWLHVPNKALIIGPFEELWTKTVVTAASVIADNIKAGVVDEKRGIVLFASAYSSAARGSWPWRMAEMTSRYIARASQEAIRSTELLKMTTVYVVAGVTDRASLLFHPCT